MTIQQSFVTPNVQKAVQAGLGAGAGIFADTLPDLIGLWEQVQGARVRYAEKAKLFPAMSSTLVEARTELSRASMALAEALDESFVQAAIAQANQDEIVTVLTIHATSGKWPWEV